MASEQWLLNDTSVASGSYWTAVGSSYKLKNVSGSTVSRTTSTPTPYEGAGCYRPISGLDLIQFYNSSSVALTGGTYYFDTYVYSRSGDGAYLLNTGNDTNVEYTGVYVDSYGYFYIATYDTVNGLKTRAFSGADVPIGAWYRMQIKATASGITEARLFKGANINGTSPDVTLTYTAGYTSFERLYGGGGNSYDTAYPALDDIKFDNTAYPTRGSSTAHTASGTSTITATGTAAMSSSRVGAGSGTGTATGTGAASRGQSVTGSASVTASGTAAMSSTQVIGASGTGTASGTAAGAVTALVTISGAGSATATGTAGASSTQVFAGSATVTATGTADSSIRPIVTVDGVGTVTATGATTASKQQTLAATASATASATAGLISITPISASATVTATATALALITTPGTLYGNAQKVAGLYGSSTKPTLTTRS